MYNNELNNTTISDFPNFGIYISKFQQKKEKNVIQSKMLRNSKNV